MPDTFQRWLNQIEDELVFLPANVKDDILDDQVISPDRNWWVSNVINGKREKHYSFSLLRTRLGSYFEHHYDIHFLFDKKNKKVYALDLGDDRILKQGDGVKDLAITWAVPPLVSNNGLCVYLTRFMIVYNSGAERKEFVYIIADPNKARKYTHSSHPTGRGLIPFYPKFKLDGDKVVMKRYSKEYVLDTGKNSFTEVRKDAKRTD